MLLPFWLPDQHYNWASFGGAGQGSLAIQVRGPMCPPTYAFNVSHFADVEQCTSKTPFCRCYYVGEKYILSTHLEPSLNSKLNLSNVCHHRWCRYWVMVQKGKTAIRGLNPNVECCHHWIIESVTGPTSRGLCKNCGAEKEFLNSSAESIREYERHRQ